MSDSLVQPQAIQRNKIIFSKNYLGKNLWSLWPPPFPLSPAYDLFTTEGQKSWYGKKRSEFQNFDCIWTLDNNGA